MSSIDEKVVFRMAQLNEVPKIMKFIRDYWPKKNHILGINEDFFRYEFCNGNRVGFFLALDKYSEEILCCIGTYFYSENHIPEKTDCSGGMFIVKPDCNIPFLGGETAIRRMQVLKPRAYVSPGIDIHTTGKLVTRVLKDKIAKMDHFYMLNDLFEYRIAQINKKKTGKIQKDNALDLILYNTVEEMYSQFDDSPFRERRPYKDKWYIDKRYFRHPV